MDYDKARRLVDSAKAAGADACKFQFWSGASRLARRRNRPDLADAYQRYQIPVHWLQDLSDHCAAQDIEFMCSTFLPEDVEIVAPFVKTLKIASFEANSRVHLAAHVEAVRAGKRILISCGAGTSREPIQAHLLNHLGSSENVVVSTRGRVDLLYCVSAYPVPVKELNLVRLRRADQWAMNTIPFTGFSDHTPPDCVLSGVVAVSAGAQVLERHFCLPDTDAQNPERPHAMSSVGLARYIKFVRQAEELLGSVAGESAAEAPLRALRVRD